MAGGRRLVGAAFVVGLGVSVWKIAQHLTKRLRDVLAGTDSALGGGAPEFCYACLTNFDGKLRYVCVNTDECQKQKPLDYDTCPSCGQPPLFVRHEATNCNKDIPASLYDRNASVLAVVGPRTSGKTVFMLVLRKVLGQGTDDLALSDVTIDPDLRSRFETNYARLYDPSSPSLPDPTPRDEVAGRPLIFQTFSSKASNGTSVRQTGFLMVSDPPGEVFTGTVVSPSTMAQVHQYQRYLSRASGLLYFFDIEASEQKKQPDPIASFDNFLTLLLGTPGFRRSDHKKPLALVLTKADVVKTNGFNLFSLSCANYGAADSLGRQLMRDMGNHGILTKAEAIFSPVHCFPCSALGRSFQNGRLVATPDPVFVDFPFTWLLDFGAP